MGPSYAWLLIKVNNSVHCICVFSMCHFYFIKLFLYWTGGGCGSAGWDHDVQAGQDSGLSHRRFSSQLESGRNIKETVEKENKRNVVIKYLKTNQLGRRWIMIFLEYQSVCPLVQIGSAHPLSSKRERPPPPPRNQREGQRSPAGKGIGGPNSDDWRRSLALCLLIHLFLTFIQ
jgi:hypothetical protein